MIAQELLSIFSLVVYHLDLALSLPASPVHVASSLGQNITDIGVCNASQGLPCSNSHISRFRIPDSSIALKIETLHYLDLAALQSLLIIANASITENIVVHGANVYSMLFPFAYDLGDGVEILLASSIDPQMGLTWGQLQTIVHGLWIFHIEGRRNRASFFDIWRLGDDDMASILGWGYIRQPMKSNTKLPSGRSIFRRSSDVFPSFPLLNGSSSQLGAQSVTTASAISHTWRFLIPNTDMTMTITARSPTIEPAVMDVLLTTMYNRLIDQIDIHGANAPLAGTPARYRDNGSGILIELMNSRLPPNEFTWGQGADVVQALALLIQARHQYRTIYVTVYNGKPESELGFGRIAKSLAFSNQNPPGNLLETSDA